jgi:hypothetical protein
LVSNSPVNETTAGTSSSSRAVVAQFFGVISAEVVEYCWQWVSDDSYHNNHLFLAPRIYSSSRLYPVNEDRIF